MDNREFEERKRKLEKGVEELQLKIRETQEHQLKLQQQDNDIRELQEHNDNILRMKLAVENRIATLERRLEAIENIRTPAEVNHYFRKIPADIPDDPPRIHVDSKRGEVYRY